jgi:hypothetical protein
LAGNPLVNDAGMTFWFGLAANLYFSSSPLPVFFLTLDRLLAMKYPMQHKSWLKQAIVALAIAVIILYNATNMAAFLLANTDKGKSLSASEKLF